MLKIVRRIVASVATRSGRYAATDSAQSTPVKQQPKACGNGRMNVKFEAVDGAGRLPNRSLGQPSHLTHPYDLNECELQPGLPSQTAH